MSKETPYKILISEETAEKLVQYQQAIIAGEATPSAHLQARAGEVGVTDFSTLSPDQFLELLIQTKKTDVFGESIAGDGCDWNKDEISILGDVNIAVPVTIFDNGVHRGAGIVSHAEPFAGELLVIPGALLANYYGDARPDMQEVAPAGTIDDEAFYKLYERRLLPSLVHASRSSEEQGAIVTIPGMGCGIFAGQFQGKLEEKLQGVLVRILEEHGDKLPNIRGINFDPNGPEFTALEGEIVARNGTKLTTKAGKFGTENSQLRSPEAYGEEYAGCKLYSIATGDPSAWPGSDFYQGNSRVVDSGVKAAATDLCAKLTGREGVYDAADHTFKPGTGQDWGSIVSREGLQLHSQGNVTVIGKDGSAAMLDQRVRVGAADSRVLGESVSIEGAMAKIDVKAR